MLYHIFNKKDIPGNYWEKDIVFINPFMYNPLTLKSLNFKVLHK